MKRWLHKIELRVDKSIPYLLVLLFFVIIGEIFFAHEIEPYRVFVSIIDGFIIFIFVIDLIFKYVRIRNFPKFFRSYWLEIIAVFPAFLVLRLAEEFIIIAKLGETFESVGETAQSALHEVVGVEKEGKILMREAERIGPGVSRLRYYHRFIRPLARFPRFLKAFSFYEKPTGRHHSYEEK